MKKKGRRIVTWHLTSSRCAGRKRNRRQKNCWQTQKPIKVARVQQQYQIRKKKFMTLLFLNGFGDEERDRSQQLTESLPAFIYFLMHIFPTITTKKCAILTSQCFFSLLFGGFYRKKTGIFELLVVLRRSQKEIIQDVRCYAIRYGGQERGLQAPGGSSCRLCLQVLSTPLHQGKFNFISVQIVSIDKF